MSKAWVLQGVSLFQHGRGVLMYKSCLIVFLIFSGCIKSPLEGLRIYIPWLD